MAFLHLNKISIPVGLGGQVTTREIGSTMRSIDGDALRSRRATKREWKFKTIPMTEEQAIALRGMILGTGHLWAYDGTTTDPIEAATNTLVASGGGLIPSTLTGGTIVGNTAADANTIANVYTAPATTDSAAARLGALGIYPASNNELPANQRIGDHGGATPFTVVTGTTLTDETTVIMDDSGESVKVVCPGGGGGAEGVASATVAAVQGETWTGSVYLLGDSGGENVAVRLVETGGAAVATSSGTITLSATEWRRVTVTRTLTEAATSGVYIQILGVDSSTAYTFYADYWQLEEKAYATAWYDGNRSSADALEYDASWLQDGTGVSISGWCNGSTSAAAASANGRIVTYGTDTNNEHMVFMSTTGPGEIGHLSQYAGVAQTDNVTGNRPYGQWFHFASVWDFAAATLKLYVNGVLGDTISSVAMLPSLIATLRVGYAYPSGGQLKGEVDDLMVLPYALDAASITALYNSGTPHTLGYPRLVATGDFIPDPSVTVIGSITSETYIGVQGDSAWENNQRILGFTLREV